MASELKILQSGDKIGIVLEKGEPGFLQGFIRADSSIRIGNLLVVDDGGKLTLVRVDGFKFINDFFNERGDLAKGMLEEPEVYDVLSLNTVINADLQIIKRYSHDTYPRPGSLIRKLPDIENNDDMLKAFYSIDSYDGIVRYGTLAGSNIPLLLDLNAITMHVGIFGETGSGKSYNMRYLIHILSRIKKEDGCTALPMIIIDANGDYVDFAGDNSGAVSECRKALPKRYTLLKYPDAEKLTIDLSAFTPRDLAEFIMSLKYGTSSYNNLQLNVLEMVLSEHDPSEFNTLLGTDTGIRKLKEEINNQTTNKDDTGVSKSTTRAILSAITIFKNKIVGNLGLIGNGDNKFDERTLERIWDTRGLAIIDFSAEGSPGVDILTKQLVVSYIARLLFKYMTEHKYQHEQRFMGFVIEEAQNYIPSNDYPVNASLTKDILVTLATQGRKFGLSLFLVSQRPAFVDKYVLSMLNTFFFHRIYHEDVRYVMSASGGLPESLSHNLTNLETGYVIVSGLMSVLKTPTLVKVPWNITLGYYAGSVEKITYVL